MDHHCKEKNSLGHSAFVLWIKERFPKPIERKPKKEKRQRCKSTHDFKDNDFDALNMSLKRYTNP